ncbi:MAG: response regulator [Planctomycetota bacterium]
MKAIVTDDSKATRMILRRLLEDLRFEVTEAVDGNEMLELLAELEVDVALVDWNMPGPNGTEVIEAMQENPKLRAVPAILVTDETQSERIEGALQAGAKAFLAKPFRIESLRTTLQEIGVEI